MRIYKDIHGNIIEAGDIIKCLIDNRKHLVELNGMETDLGINASNPKCTFISQRQLYPLRSFDTEHDWEIVEKQCGKTYLEFMR